MRDPRDTGFWADMRAVPDTLAATLDRAEGFDATAARMRDAGRIVATGNGAAYYAAMSLWLASLGGRPGPEVVALPAGIAFGRYAPRPGDLLLVISSSGELRDAVQRLAEGRHDDLAAITARPDSTLGRAAAAVACQHVATQRAETHTQAYVGSTAVALALWARVTEDEALATALGDAGGSLRREVERAEPWVERAVDGMPPPVAAAVYGTGCGWAAALEAALLLKEVARVPAEGVETREGATSAMFGLTGPSHLALALGNGSEDAALSEAEGLCSSAGATVRRWDPASPCDERLLPLLGFPASALLAARLAAAAGHDIDRPSWKDAYYATARVG